MQLVRPGVTHVRPDEEQADRRRRGARRNSASAPDKVVEVQALAGDSTDNVPGVPGIGVKTAAELIKTYGDLENLLARAGEIKQPKRRETLHRRTPRMARISRELVTLKNDVAVDAAARRLRAPRSPTATRCMAFLKANQFRTVIARVEKRRARRPREANGRRRQHADSGQAATTTVAAESGRRRRRSQRLRARADAGGARRAGSRAPTTAGVVAFDTETDLARSHAGASWSASRWRSRRARPATCRSAIAAPAAAHLGGGDGMRRCAAADPAGRGAGDAEAAAGGSRRPQDRPQHQVRHRGHGARSASRSRRSTTPC